MRRSYFINNEQPIIVEDNQIIYTSLSRNVVAPYNTSVFGATLLSNEYNEHGLITFNDSVTKIGVNAFNGKTDLHTIILPKLITILDQQCFINNTGLLTVQSDSNLITSIGASAFSGCTNLTNFNINTLGLKTIGNSALKNTNIKTFILPSSITSMGSQAFTGAGGEGSNLIIQYNPTSVSSNSSAPFYNNNFENIIFVEGVTSIGNRALANMNSSVSAVTISSTVTSIGDLAFYGLNNASTIFKIYATTPPSITSTTFNSTGTYKLQVPVGCGDAYKAAWSGVASRIIEI